MTPFAKGSIALLPGWRHLSAARLPLWGFAGSRARVQRLHALRCQSCLLQHRCRRRLAAGAVAPAPGCPNGDLFA